VNAEQKRRCNIKNGFDTLRAILPSISSNNNTKISKAAMLQKGAEHIRQLRIEHEAQEKEIKALNAQIEALNQTIG
jgi:MAX-like protein X